jgi:Flp pilus assembly protein TadB
MHLDMRRSMLLLVSCALLTLIALPSKLFAQTHVVSQADIHKELVNNAETRKANLEKVKRVFSLEVARNTVEATRMDPVRIDAAVSKLSDAELADLAARADKLQEDFAAGRLSDRDLLFIVLGIAALILIIVAVR